MITETWVCISMILLAFFVNFFLKTWLLCFVIMFLCVFLITVSEQNEWLSWVGAIVLAYSAFDGISRIYKEIGR